MQVYIIVQIIYVVVIGISLTLTDNFLKNDKIQNVACILAEAVVIFINGFLHGYYNLSDSFCVITTIVTAVALLIFATIFNAVVKNIWGR